MKSVLQACGVCMVTFSSVQIRHRQMAQSVKHATIWNRCRGRSSETGMRSTSGSGSMDPTGCQWLLRALWAVIIRNPVRYRVCCARPSLCGVFVVYVLTSCVCGSIVGGTGTVQVAALLGSAYVCQLQLVAVFGLLCSTAASCLGCIWQRALLPWQITLLWCDVHDSIWRWLASRKVTSQNVRCIKYSNWSVIRD